MPLFAACRLSSLHVSMTLLCASTALTAIPVAAVLSAEALIQFDLPPQPLADSLRAVGSRAGVNVVFEPDAVRDRQAPALRGAYSTEQALERLIGDAGLTVRSTPGGSFTLARARASQASEVRSSSEAVAPRQTAQVQAEVGDSRIAIEEVIVTATKRAENVRNVPISISVLSAQDIDRRGVVGMEDYLRSIPGVSQIDRGGQDNTIVIRGISTSAEFENLNSGTTVATYFDETPITGAGGLGTGGIDVRPVDVERIEILRGPQGTTFGSSSLGGAARIIPVKPKLDAYGGKVVGSLSATGGYGSENTMLQGVANIPFVQDVLAVRAVAYHYDESGYYKNIAGIDPAEIAFAERFGLGNYVRGYTQDDIGEMRTKGGRVAALWQASDNLDISANFLTQKIEQNGQPAATEGKFTQSRVPIAPQGRVRGQTGEISDTQMDLFSLVANYDMGWGIMTAVASRIDSGSIYTNARSRFAAALGPSSGSARSNFESTTLETRLASQFDGPFQLLAGLFYEDVEQDYLQHSGDWPGTPATNPFGTDPMFRADFRRELKQRAVFGEASYEIAESLTLTAGGRYYDYDKDSSSLQEGGLLGVPLGRGVPVILANGKDGTTFKANLSYKPNQETMLYATWSEGFRLGRPDIGVTPSVCDTNGDGLIDGTNTTVASTRNIDSDSLESYEAGAKFALAGRRMLVDASAYHIDWTGLPIRAVVTCGTTPNAYTANVGAAKSNGIEVQTSLLLGGGVRVDVGAGYVKAKLAKDAPGLVPPAFKGDRLPGAPEFTANFGAQYDFDLGAYRAFVRADSAYIGSFYGDLRQTRGVRAGDYIKIDARTGIAFEHFTLDLFVRNLTDEDAFTWRGISGALSGAGNPNFGYRMRPRTFGIELGYKFD